MNVEHGYWCGDGLAFNAGKGASAEVVLPSEAGARRWMQPRLQDATISS